MGQNLVRLLKRLPTFEKYNSAEKQAHKISFTYLENTVTGVDSSKLFLVLHLGYDVHTYKDIAVQSAVLHYVFYSLFSVGNSKLISSFTIFLNK